MDEKVIKLMSIVAMSVVSIVLLFGAPEFHNSAWIALLFLLTTIGYVIVSFKSEDWWLYCARMAQISAFLMWLHALDNMGISLVGPIVLLDVWYVLAACVPSFEEKQGPWTICMMDTIRPLAFVGTIIWTIVLLW